MNILLTRDDFRNGVFERDKHTCVFCDKPAVDAHHILERRLWPDGGYYLENGASVCATHHIDCEKTLISVEDVRFACGITKIIVPPHLYDDHIYDKWGNPILEDGRRGRGELFHDESHLDFSPGVNDDDKILYDLSSFEGRRIIVSQKLDGENCSMYRDHIHARSIDSRGGEDRAWVKQFWSRISFDIPEGWRICGENMWAEHSIRYDDLLSYFYGFSIWNEMNICLSWDETLEYFELLGIHHVPVIYDGIWNEDIIRRIPDSLDFDKVEGFVVRLADPFSYSKFKTSVVKYVRRGHVQTTKHWRVGRRFIPNKLKI